MIFMLVGSELRGPLGESLCYSGSESIEKNEQRIKDVGASVEL
jgi:hypothetical protein